MRELMSNVDMEITEEKSIKNSNLFIKNVKVDKDSYETKVLVEESIDNVLKFQVVLDEDDRILKFDVSNTISLEEYLKSYKLKKYDICNIIFAIDEVLNSMDNYLISENSLMLDLRLVRIDNVNMSRKKSLQFKFVVLPNFCGDFSHELSKLLIRILRYIDTEDKDALNLAYGLFVRSSKDSYTINDLLDLVDEIVDRKKYLMGQYDKEDLLNYDEKTLSTIADMIENENNVFYDFNNDFMEIEDKKFEDKKMIDTKEDNMEIEMDDDTKGILETEFLDNFDNDSKKKIVKTKKALNGHIKVGVFNWFGKHKKKNKKQREVQI